MATGQIKTNKTTYIVDGDTFEVIDEGARAGIASLKEDTAEKIASLKEDFSIVRKPVAWTVGCYIGTSGDLVPSDYYKYTDYIPLVNNGFFIPYYYDLQNFKNTKIGLYDESKNLVKIISTSASDSLEIVKGYVQFDTTDTDYSKVYYARFCSYATYDASVSIADLAKLHQVSLTGEVVGPINIKKDSVSEEKCSFVVHDEMTDFVSGWESDVLLYDGAIRTGYTGFYVTDYCKLTHSESYYVGSGFWLGYYAFYDANYNIIESHNNDGALTSPFTPPVGTAYGRFTVKGEANLENAWIYTSNEKPSSFGIKLSNNINTSTGGSRTNYLGDDICAFRKCLCIGDSLTEGIFNYVESSTTQYTSSENLGGGLSYPEYLSKITGLEVINKGHSSMSSDEWYNYEKNNDLSGYDIAIIQLGVNDGIRYGEFGDTSKAAFTNIITKLKTENTNIKIFVANIIPAVSYSYQVYMEVSADLLAWVTQTYANDPDVIPLDIQQYGHTKDLLAYNCGHLSAYGYYQLARDYKAYISWYMHKNSMAFRQIQFIGTNYVYTD